MKKENVKLWIMQAVTITIYFVSMSFTLLESGMDTDTLSGMLEDMLSFLIAFLLAYYLQIIVHEGGHLIFGLLSGYRFLSFRIGRFMIIQKDGKLHFKKYFLAGTSGQCLMAPPDYQNGNYPSTLYHMGGTIANLIFTVLFIAIRLIARPQGFFNSFVNMNIACGLIDALNNGVPLKTKLVSNDGWNALHQKKDEGLNKANWLILKITEKQTEGIRLKDMDESWFVYDDSKELRDQGNASLCYLRQVRAMDEKDIGLAKELIAKLLKDDVSLNGLNKQLIKADKVYIELLEKGKEADLSLLQEKDMQVLFKSMSDLPSIIRTDYAREILTGDKDKAKKLIERFERNAKSYPYTGEIETERDLMELVKVSSQTF